MRKDLNIYIVDDDPICREMFRKYLLNMNFSRISLFDNGADCLQALHGKPDIILLDYHMEVMDGLEALQAIKKHNPDIYLVFISSQENMKIAVQALRSGAFDYIIKGSDEEEKIQVVMGNIVQVMEKLGSHPSGTKWPKFLSLFSI